MTALGLVTWPWFWDREQVLMAVIFIGLGSGTVMLAITFLYELVCEWWQGRS